jgi:hypothetical protein
MFRMKSFVAAPALALLLSGTAHAALTSDQVWQSWKDAGAMIGLEVTAATENSAGGVLSLNGVSIAPAGMAGITISDMTMTTEADGSVTVAPGADIAVAMSGMAEGSIKLAHEGLVVKVHEAEGGMAYDYTAGKLDVVYDTKYAGTSFDGSEAPMVSSAGTVGLTNVSGSYSDTTGSNRVFGLDIKADKMSYSTSSDDPSMEMKQTGTSETNGVDMSFDFTLPSTMSLFAIMTPADFATALNEGLGVSLTAKQGESTGTMTQENPYMPMSLTMKSGGGEGSVVFNKDKFEVKSTVASFEIESAPGMMPMPVKITSGPMEFAMLSPVMAAAAAADYAFLLKMNQFSINEEAWAMVDPTGALKHDAADVAIDLSGKTTMDLIGMIEADETGAPPPIPAVESLNITELSAKVLGAALTSTGAFTFDNSMGFPMPLGEATVDVTGANQLIQGLIATGLLAEEDAMGAQMMMGMFMVPSGDDALTSKIEVKEGMQILVNGQPLPM